MLHLEIFRIIYLKSNKLLDIEASAKVGVSNDIPAVLAAFFRQFI